MPSNRVFGKYFVWQNGRDRGDGEYSQGIGCFIARESILPALCLFFSRLAWIGPLAHSTSFLLPPFLLVLGVSVFLLFTGPSRISPSSSIPLSFSHLLGS